MSETKEIIIPDPDEIRPRKQIPRAEIAEVVEKHQQLRALCRSTLDRAWEIGFKLRCWHDLIPHGKWLQWLRQNIPEISERSVQVYLSLWDNKEAIETHFKSAESADLEPSIKSALDFVSSRPRTMKVKVETEVRSVRGYVKIIPAKVVNVVPMMRSNPEQSTQAAAEPVPQATTETATEPAIQFATYPVTEPDCTRKRFALTLEQLAGLCPKCRAILESHGEASLEAE